MSDNQKNELNLKNEKVFSGIQSSGDLTLGNYLGAIKPFVDFQYAEQAFYCVVDLHAITVRQNPELLNKRSYEVAAYYLASGVNPSNANIFIQSHVKEHAELGWLLNTFTQMGELERMTQYKDKALQHKNNINVGLFDYPVLMAADIVLYDTTLVPVGEDQMQHIELCRDIVSRVNNHFNKNIFVLPKGFNPKGVARVRDLQDPSKKMSKSLPGLGCLLLSDDEKTIVNKVKKSVTDTLSNVKFDPVNQMGVSNLIGIYAALKGVSIDTAEKDLSTNMYGVFKQNIADAIISELIPLQNRFNGFMADKKALDDILNIGASKAREIACEKVDLFKKELGFII